MAVLMQLLLPLRVQAYTEYFKWRKMDILLLVLRLVHVFAGALWIGGALMMNFFVGSSIRATTQAEEQFADYLKAGTRLSTPLTVSAILTILAGGILYWRDSQGFTSLWMSTGPGIGDDNRLRLVAGRHDEGYADDFPRGIDRKKIEAPRLRVIRCMAGYPCRQTRWIAPHAGCAPALRH